MPFLENLVEGLSNAAGATDVSGRIEQGKADRKASAHEQLQANTKMILDEVQDLHEKKTKLHPGTDDQTIGAIDKRLGELQGSFTDLYHPEKNPGALQHLGGFLKSHLGGKKQVPSTPAEAKAKFSWASGPAGTAPPTPSEDKVGLWMKDATGNLIPARLENGKALPITMPQGMTAEGTTLPKPEAENWIPTDVTFKDGTKQTLQRNSKSGEWTDLAGNPVSKDTLASASLVPKPAAGSNSKFSQEAAVYEKQWGKKIADWTPEELSYFNQKTAYDAARSGSSTTTRLEKDENGVIHPVEITSSHGPTRPPVDPHATAGVSAPKTPGEAKKRVAATAPPRSNIREGAPLSFKGATPTVTKARNDVTEATKLSSIADQVSQNPNDAVNQKRLAVALERASAGRFTTQALDYIIKAGWGNTIEQWSNNPTTGALPKDVLRQLVDGAHQNLKASQDALRTAEGGSGKGVSLAAAKKLPAMKGKTDDEIRAAIKAAGHEVQP